ncbi:hypothetical protein N836_05365 [Leptolyngbya sp. Heron Island J]|nr:hypothetical protein N836_05365 [Leptolyngbya sp. Heron Island J]
MQSQPIVSSYYVDASHVEPQYSGEPKLTKKPGSDSLSGSGFFIYVTVNLRSPLG